MKKILLALFTASTLSAWEGVPTKGEIADGFYKDGAKKFEIALPEMGQGKMIVDDQESTEGSSHVYFADDSGELYRAEAIDIPESLYLEICANGMKETEQLKSYFNAAIVDPIADSGKEARILNADIQSDPQMGRLHYSLFFIPEGSHLIESKTNTRVSCFRAYVVRVTGDQILIFTYQPSLKMQRDMKDKSPKEISDILAKKLFHFARSYATI